MTADPPHPLGPPLAVRVPASTSNLGPGFDCLGLALSLWLDVRCVGPAAGGEHRFVALEGEALELPTDATNRLLRAFDRARAELGAASTPMEFEVRSEIPIGRGLGSSGAAVAAGLLLGAALAPDPAEIDGLLAWGLEIEGHPDNVTASLHGGLTLGVPHADGLAVIRRPFDAQLGVAVAWPARALSTADARRVLPDTVAFADAVENPRRLALLLTGLERGDARLIALGAQDRLHERHRLPLIAGAGAALAAARRAGAWLATLSGAGSGVVAIGARAQAQAFADAMREELELGGPGAEARVVEPVFGTPRVVQSAG